MGRTPAIFVGHGSPINAIKTNVFTETWAAFGEKVPNPKAILAISAHWYVPKQTSVTAMAAPETIHDFGPRLPPALFEQVYASPGSPELAQRVQELLKGFGGTGVALDREWGLDHGTWAVLLKMYPDCNIPVIQLSIDSRQPAEYHYELGQRLAPLRDEGVLILGSGNAVHNFRYLEWGTGITTKSVDWVEEWCDHIKNVVADPEVDRGLASQHPLVQWEKHPLGRKANPSPDHWLPLLYVLGTANTTEPIRVEGDIYDEKTLAMMNIVVG